MYWGQELRAQVVKNIPPGTDQLSIIQYMVDKTSNEDKVKLVLAVISLNPDSRMYFQHSRDDFIKFLDKLKALPINS